MLHRNARRDFSVEIKSAGRRSASLIPTREPKPVRIRPKPLVPQSVEAPSEEPAPMKPAVKPAQAGRILPSLIVPEPPPEPIDAAPEPKARRPYTRRAKPAPELAIEIPSPIVEPEAQPVPSPVVARTSVPPDRKRASDRDGAQQLALGQRWKRRLSRWSR